MTTTANLAHALARHRDTEYVIELFVGNSELGDIARAADTDESLPPRAAQLARERLERRAREGRKGAADLLAELDREAA